MIGDSVDLIEDIQPPINPYAFLADAASGDLDALRALALRGEAKSLSGEGYDAIMEGLVFARLAAAHGSPSDINTLIRMIAVGSRICGDNPAFKSRLDALHAELIALVAALADAGVEDADQVLAELVEGFSAQAGALAKNVHRQMMASEWVRNAKSLG